jgi:hypothetical protein
VLQKTRARMPVLPWGAKRGRVSFLGAEMRPDPNSPQFPIPIPVWPLAIRLPSVNTYPTLVCAHGGLPSRALARKDGFSWIRAICHLALGVAASGRQRPFGDAQRSPESRWRES